MILTRRILIQMAIFVAGATTALAVMVFGYMRLPEMFGIGQYRVTVELPETGGLYPRSNVTYRGAAGRHGRKRSTSPIPVSPRCCR